MTDLVIIGGGPAGITAAIYALRAGLSVVICEKNVYGGQTSIIEDIENYPGISKISGFDFASVLFKQATDFGAEFIFDEVTKVELEGETKKIHLKKHDLLEAKTVVIANGLRRRVLGCAGEKEFAGRGVSYCATCDGAFYKGKKVAVVGGGNTALEDAMYLANICSEVMLIVRKDHFRAERYLVEGVAKKSNIKICFRSRIEEIFGENKVNGIKIHSEETGIRAEKVDGVFVAIGYSPDNEIYRGQIKMSENGYFEAGEDCATAIEGVYVAGDCRVKPLRQIVTAVADGAVAGNRAAALVISGKAKQDGHIE